ncbi:UNVERIFIED_CONTAM: O-antigen ligase [Acetivibrio alkalicellulosi]
MRYKINTCYLFFLIAVIILFKPYYFTYFDISTVNFIYLNSLRLLFLGVVVFYFKEGKISRFFVSLILFYLIKGISTFINDGSISSLITEIYPAVTACLLIELGLKSRPKQLIKAFSTVLSVLIYLNFITMILNPYGYGVFEKVIFFLRHSNQLVPIYTLTIVMIVLKNGNRPSFVNKAHLLLTMAICTYMTMYVLSGSNVIAWIPVLLYYLLPLIVKKFKLLNISSYIIVYIVFFLAVIFFNVQERYSEVIYKVLGKDTTFTGRTIIWDSAINMIKERLLLGYGVGKSTNIVPYIHGRYISAHNQFIQVTLEGGILAIIAFLNILYYSVRKLMECKDENIAKILSVGLFSVLIILFSEAMGMYDLFILLCLSYNVDKIKA